MKINLDNFTINFKREADIRAIYAAIENSETDQFGPFVRKLFGERYSLNNCKDPLYTRWPKTDGYLLPIAFNLLPFVEDVEEYLAELEITIQDLYIRYGEYQDYESKLSEHMSRYSLPSRETYKDGIMSKCKLAIELMPFEQFQDLDISEDHGCTRSVLRIKGLPKDLFRVKDEYPELQKKAGYLNHGGTIERYMAAQKLNWVYDYPDAEAIKNGWIEFPAPGWLKCVFKKNARKLYDNIASNLQSVNDFFLYEIRNMLYFEARVNLIKTGVYTSKIDMADNVNWITRADWLVQALIKVARHLIEDMEDAGITLAYTWMARPEDVDWESHAIDIHQTEGSDLVEVIGSWERVQLNLSEAQAELFYQAKHGEHFDKVVIKPDLIKSLPVVIDLESMKIYSQSQFNR